MEDNAGENDYVPEGEEAEFSFYEGSAPEEIQGQ